MKLIKQTDMLSREEALEKINKRIFKELDSLGRLSIYFKYVDNGIWGKESRTKLHKKLFEISDNIDALRELHSTIRWSTESRFRLELD